MIEARGLTKRYGDTLAVDGLSFDVAARPGHGLPRSQRVGQVHHHAHGDGARPARRRERHGRRPPLPRPAVAAPRGRWTARVQGRAPRTQRLQPSVGVGPDQRHRPRARRRAARAGGAGRGGAQASREVLAGHDPAARHRRGTPRRSRGAAVRRAHQRARSRGHPVGADAAQAPGGGGAGGVRVEPSHERDGAHRRSPRRDRPGQAHRRPARGRRSWPRARGHRSGCGPRSPTR